MSKSFETGLRVYRSYPKRLESLTVCRCLHKLSYLKAPGSEPCDLPRSRPAVIQLS